MLFRGERSVPARSRSSGRGAPPHLRQRSANLCIRCAGRRDFRCPHGAQPRRRPAPPRLDRGRDQPHGPDGWPHRDRDVGRLPRADGARTPGLPCDRHRRLCSWCHRAPDGRWSGAARPLLPARARGDRRVPRLVRIPIPGDRDAGHRRARAVRAETAHRGRRRPPARRPGGRRRVTASPQVPARCRCAGDHHRRHRGDLQPQPLGDRLAADRRSGAGAGHLRPRHGHLLQPKLSRPGDGDRRAPPQQRTPPRAAPGAGTAALAGGHRATPRPRRILLARRPVRPRQWGCRSVLGSSTPHLRGCCARRHPGGPGQLPGPAQRKARAQLRAGCCPERRGPAGQRQLAHCGSAGRSQALPRRAGRGRRVRAVPLREPEVSEREPGHLPAQHVPPDPRRAGSGRARGLSRRPACAVRQPVARRRRVWRRGPSNARRVCGGVAVRRAADLPADQRGHVDRARRRARSSRAG